MFLVASMSSLSSLETMKCFSLLTIVVILGTLPELFAMKLKFQGGTFNEYIHLFNKTYTQGSQEYSQRYKNFMVRHLGHKVIFK